MFGNMGVDLVVLGVASSAGTHYAGQERAPAALRAAGLIDRLIAAGLRVADRGDVVTEAFAVDHTNATRRNFPAVLRTTRQVADVVGGVVADGALPLVLGGDCTVTVGVVAGVRRVAQTPACSTSTATPTLPPQTPPRAASSLTSFIVS